MIPNLRDLLPAGLSVGEQLITNTVDPQLAYMWEVSITSPNRPHDFERNIQLYARNCTIPQRSVEEMNRSFVGEQVSHPGYATDTRQIRLTMWDDQRLIGYRYFTDWMNIISDPSYGRQVSPDRYKKNVKVRLKDRTDFFVGVEIEFRNAYIMNIGEATMTYDESIPYLYNVGMHYEEMILNNVDYSLESGTQTFAGDRVTRANREINRVTSNFRGRF